jgi:hypothetical protein
VTRKAFKGEFMKKHCMRILIAVLSVAGFGAVAMGQSVDKVEVKIPYEFVVGGQTLPAGTYTVDRVGSGDPRDLVLSSYGHHTSAIFVATEFEENSGNKTEISFKIVGGQRFLSEIRTAEHVFTIPVTQTEILEAAARSNGGASAMERSAGNK